MNKIAAHLLKLRCSKFHTSPKRFDGKNLSKPSTETPPKVESVTGEIGKLRSLKYFVTDVFLKFSKFTVVYLFQHSFLRQLCLHHSMPL